MKDYRQIWKLEVNDLRPKTEESMQLQQVDIYDVHRIAVYTREIASLSFHLCHLVG